MNRRGFLTSLLAGAVAPAFLPGAGRKWIAHKSGLVTPRTVLNPAWVNAPFELGFIWDHDKITLFLKNGGVTPDGNFLIPSGFPDDSIILHDPYPIRYLDAEGKNPVYPFITVNA